MLGACSKKLYQNRVTPTSSSCSCTFITEQKPYGKHKHFYGPLRALAVRASTGGLGRSVESRGRRRGDKELLLQSQQPSADGLRVSHDRSERDALLVVHLERARAPSREPVVGAVNRTLALLLLEVW